MSKLFFESEPRGATYRRLLCYAQTLPGAQFGFVVRTEAQPSPTRERLIGALEMERVQVRRESEWPGTSLLNGYATVYLHTFTEHSERVLEDAADGLYEWRHPSLPEDLFLAVENGGIWLWSVAHEREAGVFVSQDRLVDLEREAPDVLALLRAEG